MGGNCVIILVMKKRLLGVWGVGGKAAFGWGEKTNSYIYQQKKREEMGGN